MQAAYAHLSPELVPVCLWLLLGSMVFPIKSISNYSVDSNLLKIYIVNEGGLIMIKIRPKLTMRDLSFLPSRSWRKCFEGDNWIMRILRH